MEFLNPNEKIKKLRKELYMKQHDFVDVSMTRSYFGMIESGKRNLTEDTAVIIYNKLKYKAKELGISLDRDISYIMRTAKEDASIYCHEKLKNIQNIAELDKIITIAKKYELYNVQASSYIKKGDMFFSQGNYSDALINYVLSIDIYINTLEKDLPPMIYNKLGDCRAQQMQYKEAVIYYKFAYHYSMMINDAALEKQAVYNLAVCSKKNKSIDDSLVYIDIYLKLCSKEEDLKKYISITCLKADCYRDKGDIKAAIDIYKGLISETDDNSGSLLAYINNSLGCLYFDLEMFDLSINCFDKAFSIQKKLDLDKASCTLIAMSEVYVKQKLFDNAIPLINKGIELSIKYADNENILKGYYLLIDIYKAQNNYINLEKTYLKMVLMLENNREMIHQLMKAYLELQLFYHEHGNYEKALYYLRLSKVTLDLLE